MEDWKRTFVQKLEQAQSRWAAHFAQTVDRNLVPVFDELSVFLSIHGFRCLTPLCEPARRSFKFELAENAYVLFILRSTGVGEFELVRECFVPGQEPVRTRAMLRLADATRAWAQQQFQSGLDQLVERLGGQAADAESSAPSGRVEELVGVG